MPKRPPLTHFLCIPLVTSLSRPRLEQALSEFTIQVTREAEELRENEVKIPARAVRPIGSIHLTLGVMSLDTEKLEGAKIFVRNLDIASLLKPSSAQGTAGKESSMPQSSYAQSSGPTVLRSKESNPLSQELNASSKESPTSVEESDPSPVPSSDTIIPPLVVSLTGIQPMQSPTSTTILYATPTDSSSRLFPFCETIRKAFTDSGFLLPDSRPLKLHATIVNTIYVKGRSSRKKSGGHDRDRKEKLKIDATKILKEFENHVWMGNVRLDRLSVCEMGAKKVEVDGKVVEEYLEVESVRLP